MRINFNIKPYSDFTGIGTKKEALARLESRWGLRAVPNCFSTYGDFQHRGLDHDTAWLYTIQVYKHGKHRKCKNYHVWVYRVPIKTLGVLGIKMSQMRNGIKIEKLNK